MSVQAPILLRTGEPLVTEKVTVSLYTDSVPTASITMPEAGAVKMHDLIEIFTVQGSAGIFRVTSRAEAFAGQTELTLSGALDTLSDDIWAEETSEKDTIPNLITAILSKQSVARWQLGTCAKSNTISIDVRYSGLLDLLRGVLDECRGCRWVFDYTTTPWTLSLAELDDTIVSEFRVGRNVAGATIDISDAEMCTRLYMTVSTDTSSTLHVYNNTAAQAEWGIICKLADVKADNAPDPDAYGAAILAERAQPIAFISIDGEDLKCLTGDDFDRITLGSRCRVVLDGYTGAFVETVTGITWEDALGQPDKISVNLANNLKPFTEQLNLIRKTAGGAASRNEEQERELIRHQTGIDQNNDHIMLWATEEEWDEIAEQYRLTHQSQFEITATEIESTVAQTGVTPNLKFFSTTQSYAVGDKVLHGQHQAYVFTSAHSPGPWDPTEVSEILPQESRITQQANKIALVVTESGGQNKVNTASIVLAINDNTSTAKINASHVELTSSGTTVTLDDAMVVDGNGVLVVEKNLIVAGTPPNQVSINNGKVSANNIDLKNGGALKFIGSQSGEYYTLDTSVVPGIIKSASVSGNTLTLTPIYGNAITFSKAVTRIDYGWSNGALTVTAQPQNYSDSSRILQQGTASWSGTAVTIPIVAKYGDQGQYTEPTGLSAYADASSKLETATVDTAGTYTLTPSSGKIGFSSVSVNVSGGGSVCDLSNFNMIVNQGGSTPRPSGTYLSTISNYISSLRSQPYGGYITFTGNPGSKTYVISVG